MANATPSRLGQADATGATDALFLKVFAGEVLTSFHRNSAFRPRHQVRVIASGKSAQFPVTGQVAAFYHTPGSEILGQTLRANERVITIDDQLIAPAFLANVDEAKNHYEVRSIYSGEIGEALAKQYDQNVGRVFVNAARTGAVITGANSGGYSEDAGYSSDGTKLWTGIFNAGVQLDTKDIPANERYGWIKPVQYALVVQSEKPINRDLNPSGNNGSIASGNVEMVNSIILVKTNNLPSANDVGNTDLPTARQHDFSPTQVLIGHRSAAGTVQLQDITMESAYDIRRQGTLMVGKYLVGHGELRPEAAYELRTGAPAG
jgi:hypothetical protein